MFYPIQQGDQYYLPVVITQGGTTITPDNVDDVKIKFGSLVLQYSEGDIEYDLYDSTNKGWLFPLTQELTLALENPSVPMQVQIRQGTNVFGSDVETVPIDFSIITEEW